MASYKRRSSGLSYFFVNLSMTVIEIKTEIQKALDNVPEEALSEILDIVKKFQQQSADEYRWTKNLEKVINEDRELLQKLAQ